MIDFGSLTLTDVKKGTLIQGRIIAALVMREMRTRFGEMQLGYAWALIEPLVQIGILVTIFSMLGRRPPLGTSFEAFFLNGYVPYAMYSQISSRTAQAIAANRALVSFPPVRNMDTVWARIGLETATGITSFILLILIFTFIDINVVPNDVVNYFFGFVSVIALGAGLDRKSVV
jgi:capsular polysaccharide transport system permease protein